MYEIHDETGDAYHPLLLTKEDIRQEIEENPDKLIANHSTLIMI